LDPPAAPAFPVSLADPALVALPAGPELQEQTAPTVPTVPGVSTGSLARGEAPDPRVYRARLGQRVMQARRATGEPAGQLVPGVVQGPLVRPASQASTHKHACGLGLHGHSQVWPRDPRLDEQERECVFILPLVPGEEGGLRGGVIEEYGANSIYSKKKSLSCSLGVSATGVSSTCAVLAPLEIAGSSKKSAIHVCRRARHMTHVPWSAASSKKSAIHVVPRVTGMAPEVSGRSAGSIHNFVAAKLWARTC